MNPYITDILSQPDALREAINNFSAAPLFPLIQRLLQGEFDRILITGMGASYNAAYPALLQLTGQPLPVMLVNTAELLHYSSGLIGNRTLLWLNSQSGRSVELIRLIGNAQIAPPAYSLACVNDIASPLALAADACLPIHAGVEATVSTRTYLNMLAVNLLTAITLLGDDPSSVIPKLLSAAAAMEPYLSNWQAHVAKLDAWLAEVKVLVILGRGASLAAVWNGSLISKEAAKCAFEGMHAADFRHGPLELASPDLTVLMFQGARRTAQRNRDLALEVARSGGRVLWLAQEPDAELTTLLLPSVEEIALPFVEILPLQMLTILMAQRKGIEPGVFRHVSKITARE